MKKTLIVCHGWGANPLVYKKFIKQAPSDWDVIVLDYQIFAKDKDLEKFNQNLLTFLKENNLKKVHLLGHSLGGVIALQFALHNPQKIERLFLVDSKGVYHKEHFLKPFLLIFFNSLKHFISEFWLSIITLYKILQSPSWHLHMGFLAHATSLEKEAKILTVSTTIIWGEKDPVAPLWQGETLHQWIKKSELIVLPKMGHNWIVYYPELFWRVIK